jgi:hypothetical protein
VAGDWWPATGGIIDRLTRLVAEVVLEQRRILMAEVAALLG